MKDKMIRAVLFLIAFVILILAFTPVDYAADTGFNDKINHMAAFALLAVLGCASYQKYYLRIAAGLLLYGIMIEIVQLFIPGRSCSILDLCADISGIAAGFCFYAFIVLVRKKLSAD